MGDWEFGSAKDMQEAAKKTRNQPPSAKRMGEIIGGTISIVAAVAVLHFLLTWERYNHSALGVFFAFALGGLFAGAWVGGKVATSMYGDRQL
jgi:hypothetical protein